MGGEEGGGDEDGMGARWDGEKEGRRREAKEGERCNGKKEEKTREGKGRREMGWEEDGMGRRKGIGVNKGKNEN